MKAQNSMHVHLMRRKHLLLWDLSITRKVIGKTLIVTLLSGWTWAVKAEEVLIRPSVWGQDKWYGGYELFSGDKKIGAVRPSVWGTEKWPGGYDLLAGERKAGEAKASEWGQTKWYGGYDLKLDENDKKVFESVLRNILNK
jgi:hypothetical protein